VGVAHVNMEAPNANVMEIFEILPLEENDVVRLAMP
jgi:hypothetical protein